MLNNDLKLINWKKASIWTGKGFFAVLDQGIFAGTNFIVNILLARWFSSDDYGIFSVVYSILLLFMGIHTAILTEPMLVFGAGRHRKYLKTYLGVVAYGHLIISGVVMILLVFCEMVLKIVEAQQMSEAIVGLIFSSPLILLLWLFRRAFIIKLRPDLAAVGGAVYMVIFLVTIFVLKKNVNLTPARVLFSMGGASFIASIILISIIRPDFNHITYSYSSLVARDHWNYSKWSIGTTTMMWIPGNIYFLVLPSWIGLQKTAELRAVLNLLMPFLHTVGALSSLLLPLLSTRIANKNYKEADKLVKTALILFLFGSLLFWLILFYWEKELFNLLYAGKFSEAAGFVKIAGISIVSVSIVTVIGTVLRATEKPDKVFWGYLVALAVTLGVGLPATKLFGLIGVMIGMVGASMANALTLCIFWQQNKRTQS